MFPGFSRTHSNPVNPVSSNVVVIPASCKYDIIAAFSVTPLYRAEVYFLNHSQHWASLEQFLRKS